MRIQRPAVLQVNDEGVIERTAGAQIEAIGELRGCRQALERDHAGAVGTAAAADLLDDAADLQRVRVGAVVGDESAHALRAIQVPRLCQLAQCAIHGHARGTERAHELVLGGDALRDLPGPVLDELDDVALDAVVERAGSVALRAPGCQGGACGRGCHGGARIHGYTCIYKLACADTPRKSSPRERRGPGQGRCSADSVESSSP